jgi:hypothetical protein
MAQHIHNKPKSRANTNHHDRRKDAPECVGYLCFFFGMARSRSPDTTRPNSSTNTEVSTSRLERAGISARCSFVVVRCGDSGQRIVAGPVIWKSRKPEFRNRQGGQSSAQRAKQNLRSLSPHQGFYSSAWGRASKRGHACPPSEFGSDLNGAKFCASLVYAARLRLPLVPASTEISRRD